MEGPEHCAHPITWIQRIALYETKSRLYLVGSNNTHTSFKVLKIDRTDNDLNIIDDRIEYNYQEIRELLVRIHDGNRTPTQPAGITQVTSAFGLVGFAKFLHGYYLILITKRRKVASIGYHSIYKIEETKVMYIPNHPPSDMQNEETRYLKTFCNIDLSSNFYFSYSYDISQNLQYNLTPINVRKLAEKLKADAQSDEGGSLEGDSKVEPNEISGNIDSDNQPILIRSEPHRRFVWNSNLIDVNGLHPDWKLYLIHGFVSQANICVYSKPIYITLVARRSQRYSGPRFLKRGLNCCGDVANEVETEQIVHDASISSFKQGYFTSFVQVRGSIPDRWSQDLSKMVPKPPIRRDFVDPYCHATGRHFNDLMNRYGSPIIVLNLIKKKEKKQHEGQLHKMFSDAIDYLNQFLPPHHTIRHIAYDIAHYNKRKDTDVMAKLERISFNVVRVCGIFQSWNTRRKIRGREASSTSLAHQRSLLRRQSSLIVGGYRLNDCQRFQTGVVRVNCIDSLDRTNTAQFVMGKTALAFQMHALDLIKEPNLDYETDSVRLLEQLYEDHGDTIALQYGGSQLVHRIRTYRNAAQISTQSRDIMQTISRYYRNTFSDADKQNAINLFLGVYKPSRYAQSHLWNLCTDYYLHNKFLSLKFDLALRENSYCRWWDQQVIESLPRASRELHKHDLCFVIKTSRNSLTNCDRRDFFHESYKPYQLTVISDTFPFQMLHTIRDIMPGTSQDYSPFVSRNRELQLTNYSPFKDSRHRCMSSASSTTSSTTEMSVDSEQEDDSDNLVGQFRLFKNQFMDRSFTGHAVNDLTDCDLYRETNCTTSFVPYGQLRSPSVNDLAIYGSYVDLGQHSGEYASDGSVHSNNGGKNKNSGHRSSFKFLDINSNDMDLYRQYCSYNESSPGLLKK